MQYVRWVVLSIFVLAGAWLVLAGPAPREIHKPGYTIIRYWEKWTGEEAEKMKVHVKNFNDGIGEQKKIYVQYLSMTNVDQKTLISTAGGVPPEVAGLWQGQVGQWGAMRAVTPLTEMAAKKGMTKDYYKKVYWDACSYNGELIGMVSTPATIMLHWNKGYFKQRYEELVKENEALVAAGQPAIDLHGFDGTRAPWTISEMDAWCKLMTKRDAKGKLVVAGYIPSEPGWWKSLTPIMTGGRLYDPQNKKFSFTSPECVKAFEWYQSYSKKDKLGFDAISDFSSGFGNFSSPQNPFLAGKVAMTLQGAWMVEFIQNNKPEWIYPKYGELDPNSSTYKKDFEALKAEYQALSVARRREIAGWGIAPMPSVFSDAIVAKSKAEGWDKEKTELELRRNGAAFCDFDVLVIPSTAKNKEEAFEFIAYINSKEVMEKVCESHGKPTPLAGRPDEKWMQGHRNPYIEYFDQIADSPNSQARPKVPGVGPQMERDLSDAVDRITRAPDAPVLPELQKAYDRVQAQLDAFLAVEEQRHGKSKEQK
jgi:multiple sugar transport system substrate-binding protein